MGKTYIEVRPRGGHYYAISTLKRKFPEMSLSEALSHLEHVAWVRFGAGKLVREWATRLTNQQEEILSALGATRYLPSP